MTGRIVTHTPSGKPIKHGGAGTAYSAHGCRCDECRAANARRVARRKAERDSRTGDFRHGTVGGYTNWGCRCDECSNAWHARMVKDRASRKARLEDAPHGTESGYIAWGCRCKDCREAARLARRERQERAS